MVYKKRDSRFEIIRILSMVFIVMYHYSLYGNWSKESLNTFKINLFSPWGQVGVALFVMITGYFLSPKSSNLTDSFNRVKPLWIKTITYSWIILILSFFLKFRSFSNKQSIFAVFPVIFDEYWFITCYIVLMFLIPILNLIIIKVDKRKLLYIIVIIVVITDIMPYLQNTNPNAPLGSTFSTGAMLSPYLISAFIRKYKIKVNAVYSFFIFIIGCMLEYGSMIFLSVRHSERIDGYTAGLFPLITAIGIFCLFLNLSSFSNKYVNFVASGVLASYLITEHPIFRLYFWHELLNVHQYQNNIYNFIEMGIIIPILTVILCSLIDKVYSIVRDYLNNKIVDI